MGKKKNKTEDNSVTIGIPRGLLYYKYGILWENFLYYLGIKYIISPETDKTILIKGINIAVDETCLPSKIYLGHVDWLIGKCDYILVPRLADFGKSGTVCTKHQAMYDVVMNTFRDRDFKVLVYQLDKDSLESEVSAFVKMGRALGKERAQIMLAYWNAKQMHKAHQIVRLREQKKLLESSKIKILVISHMYNANDRFIGEPIFNIIEQLDAIPVKGNIIDEKAAIRKSEELSETLPWIYNKELLGAIAEYRKDVDGIILMSSFPCGPDSMVNEIIVRRVKDIPILNLILDGQDAIAGMETRIESFLDIIKFRKEQRHA
ncbi:MAG: acyl-CoA dehydratase activase-related protein [Clostridia bacterium]|nr:acyl-CoA dehydratase activase-related protein [Clostridia bacterium]